jgi:citronellyl-CoA dehydrogenase
MLDQPDNSEQEQQQNKRTTEEEETLMIFTQEHNEIRRTVKNFVDNEINPYIEEWEKAGEYPIRELFKKLGNLGILGIHKPEKYGGMGLDYSYNLIAAEELGNCGAGGVPLSVGVQTDMCTPAIARFGSDNLKEEFLAPAIRGEMIGCIGVSETGAGSDVAGLKTTARKDGDDYLINGSKMWITNSPKADFICLLANTSEGKPHQNKSLIVVPMNTPGISLSPHLDKLGMRSSETAQVFFDDVRIPQRNRIGAEGTGFMLQMIQFQEERLWGAANTLKALESCVDKTIAYCRERKTFGRPLIDNQVIHFRLAELQTEIESLRALTYQACEMYVAGKDVTKLASMAKLKAGRLGREVTDSCLQYWGGMGFMWDNPVSRAYRDVRLVSIGGGADEIMLGIICKLMGTLPGKPKS